MAFELVTTETAAPYRITGADPSYTTNQGAAYCGDSLNLLDLVPEGSVNLVMTSPPFSLLRKKEYGNRDQAEYLDWLTEFARRVKKVLTNDGKFRAGSGRCIREGRARKKSLQLSRAAPLLR